MMVHKQIRVALILFFGCALFSQLSTVSAESSEATQLYETAFRLIVAGDYSEAYDRLNEIIDKHPDTVYARFAENRKQRLEQLKLPTIRRKGIDQSGRIETVVFSTLYSTWLGIGTARLIDDTDSAKTVAGGMMIGAPTGLLTSLIATRNAKLSRGQSALINASGVWGTWQGLGWAILISENDGEKPLIGSAIIGGVSSILATARLTRRIDPSLGDVRIINYGAFWGTWLSMSAGRTVGLSDGDALLAWTLIGGNIGAATMAALSPKIDITPARAHWINLGGVIGTIVASGIVTGVGEGDVGTSAAFGTLTVGGIAGLIAAIYNTRHLPPPAPRYLGRPSDSTRWEQSPHNLQLTAEGVHANFLNLQF